MPSTSEMELRKDEHYIHHDLKCYSHEQIQVMVQEILNEFPPLMWGTHLNNIHHQVEKEENVSIGFGHHTPFIKNVREFDVYYVKVLRFKSQELCRRHCTISDRPTPDS